MKAANDPVTRAAVYCRISKDANETGLGVARQERECRALVDRNAWAVEGVYVDNDTSAYNGAARPEFQRMMGDVERGVIDAIVAWHSDRLYRRFDDLMAFTTVIETTGIRVETVTAGRVDLSTASGRMSARMLGTVAAYESEHKSERIRSKMDELAMAGKSSGRARTFGYDRPRTRDGKPVPLGEAGDLVPGTRPEVISAEAERIREAARRVLAGESLYSVVQDWEAAGVPTIQGAPWSTTALKTILTSARIAGLRVHRGEVVGQAEWDAILDEPTWQKVSAILTDPKRKRPRGNRPYLLTGIARCGDCGHPLVATPRTRKRGGGKRGVYIYEKGHTQRAYGCVKANGGCGSVFVLAEPLEEWVVDRLHTALDGAGLARAVARLDDGSAGDENLLAQIAQYEESLAELSRDYYVDKRIERRAFLAAQEPLQGRIEKARSRLAERSGTDALDGIVDLEREWKSLSLERKRSIVEAVMSPVVSPARGPRNRFDAGRVNPGWLV